MGTKMYGSRREAVKAARAKLGPKARENLMFVVFCVEGRWGYVAEAWETIKRRLLSR